MTDFLRVCLSSSYAANEDGRVGVYVTANPLTPENNYFEVEILDTGMVGAVGRYMGMVGAVGRYMGMVGAVGR